MKAYKIDLSGFTGKVRELVSEAVQKKAFELGYEWEDGKQIQRADEPYLYLPGVNKVIDWGSVPSCFRVTKNELIPAADFLALETAQEPVFKPFDKVLVRDNAEDEDDWSLAQFSHVYELTGHFVVVGGIRWDQCIPYEGNEHLLGTTNKE